MTQVGHQRLRIAALITASWLAASVPGATRSDPMKVHWAEAYLFVVGFVAIPYLAVFGLLSLAGDRIPIWMRAAAAFVISGWWGWSRAFG